MVGVGAALSAATVATSVASLVGDRLEHRVAVDDADATAERAAQLGGQVVVAPFDAPWVRTTVITDPQGATFTASKFVPENRSLAQEAGASAAS
jgi:predicted enzyme related to lactoylglutathione lyase